MHTALVIEDHAEVRDLVRAALALTDEPVTVFEAADGDSGLDTARIVRPHVVLLDVMMPGALDGFAVCKLLREDPRTRAARIVMMTARGHATDVHAGKLAGCDAYVIKPFSPLQLTQTVNALLRTQRRREAVQ